MKNVFYAVGLYLVLVGCKPLVQSEQKSFQSKETGELILDEWVTPAQPNLRLTRKEFADLPNICFLKGISDPSENADLPSVKKRIVLAALQEPLAQSPFLTERALSFKGLLKAINSDKTLSSESEIQKEVRVLEALIAGLAAGGAASSKISQLSLNGPDIAAVPETYTAQQLSNIRIYIDEVLNTVEKKIR